MSSRKGCVRRLPGAAAVLVLWIGVSAAAAVAAGPRAQPDAADSHRADKPRVGIALGAGGANGLAHVLMLEALDELQVTPHRIAGSSIGAVVGALYAAGMSGAEIRELARRLSFPAGGAKPAELLAKDALRWMELLDLELGQGGVLSSDGFMAFLGDNLECDTFEELRIPLRVTAADLWSRSQVVLESGDLLPAIQASTALPGVFRPVLRDGRVLIDGGSVNPVPSDLLTGDCDIVIGVDVSGERTPPDPPVPGYFETIFNSVKVMQQAILSAKRQREEIAILIAPRIVDVRALEFYRADEIFAQAEPAKAELKRRLAQLLREW